MPRGSSWGPGCLGTLFSRRDHLHRYHHCSCHHTRMCHASTLPSSVCMHALPLHASWVDTTYARGYVGSRLSKFYCEKQTHTVRVPYVHGSGAFGYGQQSNTNGYNEYSVSDTNHGHFRCSGSSLTSCGSISDRRSGNWLPATGSESGAKAPAGTSAEGSDSGRPEHDVGPDTGRPVRALRQAWRE